MSLHHTLASKVQTYGLLVTSPLCTFISMQPETVKENAIIEKTAKFIAEHGVQMEIVMKTKQANNPKFQFMHFENVLHPFYKHLVKMIKSKKYIPKSPAKETADQHNDSEIS